MHLDLFWNLDESFQFCLNDLSIKVASKRNGCMNLLCTSFLCHSFFLSLTTLWKEKDKTLLLSGTASNHDKPRSLYRKNNTYLLAGIETGSWLQSQAHRKFKKMWKKKENICRLIFSMSMYWGNGCQAFLCLWVLYSSHECLLNHGFLLNRGFLNN